MSTVDTFDDIIVGAGSAGIPLAARLSADPSRRVVRANTNLTVIMMAERLAEMLRDV